MELTTASLLVRTGLQSAHTQRHPSALEMEVSETGVLEMEVSEKGVLEMAALEERELAVVAALGPEV